MRPVKVLIYICSVLLILGLVAWLWGGGESWGGWVRVPRLPEELCQNTVSSDDEGVVNLDSVMPSFSDEADVVNRDSVITPLPSSEGQGGDLGQGQAQGQEQGQGRGLRLPRFTAALQRSDSMPVRVVHFGDSQIEEDRISMNLRHRWQERYGGGGVGLVPLVQTVPTFTVKQAIEREGSPVNATTITRYIAYGPARLKLKDDNLYGPMAQVAVIDQPVDLRLSLLNDKVRTNAFDKVRILADDSVQVMLEIPTDSLPIVVRPDSLTPHLINLPLQARNAFVHLTGKGRVYGISTETSNGVQVDNIPMRGASGLHFTTMNDSLLSRYFADTHTALIILQFGGNAMPAINSSAAVRRYVENMRQQVAFLQACAPEADILFVGPADMIVTIEGVEQSHPQLPLLDRSLQAMIEEQGGAYYSLFRMMGGAGSMLRWQEKGLAGDDLIHFTRAGARRVGEKLAKEITEL